MMKELKNNYEWHNHHKKIKLHIKTDISLYWKKRKEKETSIFASIFPSPLQSTTSTSEILVYGKEGEW